MSLNQITFYSGWGIQYVGNQLNTQLVNVEPKSKNIKLKLDQVHTRIWNPMYRNKSPIQRNPIN